jgi:hypothetical protein
MQIGQILLARKPVKFPFKTEASMTLHLVSHYVPNDMDVFSRYGFAAFTWGLVAAHDTHYRLVRVDNEMILHKILKEGLDAANEGDLIVLTNMDICLTKEAPAVLWAFMINRGLSICYNSRVDVSTDIPLQTEDIENFPQYLGIDTFVFIKNKESLAFLSKASEYNLEIGRVAWDVAWVKLIDGLSGFNKCPYAISYHRPHPNTWQLDPESNLNNQIESNKIFEPQDIRLDKNNVAHYSHVPWI